MVRMRKWCNLGLHTEVVLEKWIASRGACESGVGAVFPLAAAAGTEKEERNRKIATVPPRTPSMIMSILGWEAVMLDRCVFVEVMVGLFELVVG
jgi:hypothetical protein